MHLAAWMTTHRAGGIFLLLVAAALLLYALAAPTLPRASSAELFADEGAFTPAKAQCGAGATLSNDGQ